jgi:hypothetical protein
MSLINDALKKAQKQRTGEAPPLAGMPSIGGESPGRIAKRAKPASFNALFLRVGLGAGALLIVTGVGAYYAFRSPAKQTATPPAQTSPSVAKPQDEPQPASPVVKQPGEPAVVSTKAVEPAPTFNLPIAAPPAVVEPPVAVVPKPAPVPVVTVPPAQKAPVVPSVAVKPQPAAHVAKTPDEPVPAAAKMDNKAVAYIENLRIAGIRASATDSKVLMNDRVYRIGDMVEREMGLKLIGITSSSMTFEDERGARYTRNF